MERVIDATKKYGFKDENKVFYCVEHTGYTYASKIISIFDLDNDGVERIGDPGDPYGGNMFWGKKMSYKLYNAFETEEEALSLGGEVLKVSFDSNYKVVKKIKITPVQKVACK